MLGQGRAEGNTRQKLVKRGVATDKPKKLGCSAGKDVGRKHGQQDIVE